MAGFKVITEGQYSEFVAQLVEQRPFKALVVGSNPTELTISHCAQTSPLRREEFAL